MARKEDSGKIKKQGPVRLGQTGPKVGLDPTRKRAIYCVLLKGIACELGQ